MGYSCTRSLHTAQRDDQRWYAASLIAGDPATQSHIIMSRDFQFPGCSPVIACDVGDVDAVQEEIGLIVGSAPIYLSFEVDGWGPVHAPVTGNPRNRRHHHVGSVQSARRAARTEPGRRRRGEVSPPFDPSGNRVLVGATLRYARLCLLAEGRPRVRGHVPSTAIRVARRRDCTIEVYWRQMTAPRLIL